MTGGSDDRPTPNRMRVAAADDSAPVDPKRRPRYALLVMSQRGTSSLFTLPDTGEVTLGRGDSCTLRIDDPLLSRVHATVRRRGENVEVVDLTSRNGTWVGAEPVAPDAPRALAVGDTIKLGTSCVVLQFAAGGVRMRRVWTHAYFEARLEEECGRASQSGRPFAVVRVRAAPAAKESVERALLEVLRPIDVIATYADGDYEVLLVETTPHVARALANDAIARLAGEKVAASSAIACYPSDGRTPESIIARVAAASAGASAGAGLDGARSIVQAGALARLEPVLAKVAAASISVLLLGETGVGKEVLARIVHERSPRASKRLVCLNCASLSESLLESELFGHEKGAFTGALAAKAGLLESANGGTAFLDEVGEMPLGLQAKLLRVIEEREVLRVGAVTPRPIDVRFIAATNRDLQHEIGLGHFRQDLYFRLNGFSIVMPPLRERRDEIEPLARHFVELACKSSDGKERPRPELDPGAIRALLDYEWPGNVRELRNVIDRAVLLSNGVTITAEHVARESMGRWVTPAPAGAAPPDWSSEPAASPVAAADAGDDPERARLIAALEECVWNQTQAAKLLGISRRTLVNRLEEYDLPRPRKRG